MFSIRLYRFGAYQNEMYIIYVIQTDRNQRKVLIMCKYELYHVSNKMH
jgi:ribosomal protein S16